MDKLVATHGTTAPKPDRQMGRQGDETDTVYRDEKLRSSNATMNDE